MPVEAPRDRTQQIPDDLQKPTERSVSSVISAAQDTIAKSRELMRRIDKLLSRDGTGDR
jgi:hypothetical protein